MKLRPALLASLTLGLGAAEVARRDLQIAVETASPAFTYTIKSPVGAFSGEDGFDRDLVLRPGVRWAIARPGSAWAPLLGVDGSAEDATLPGGGLRAYGVAAAAGATWTPGERVTIDGEGWAGWSQATLDLSTTDGGSISGSGTQNGLGVRLRGLWQPARRWSLGVELGWSRRSTAIAGDLNRDLSLESSGWSAGLVLAWRYSGRPAGLE